MKKIILVIAVIMAAVAAQAQTVVEDKVIDGETIRYVTEHLSSEELTALLAFVHVDITLYVSQFVIVVKPKMTTHITAGI